jgi:hypothetical protein
MGYFVQGHGTLVLRPNTEHMAYKALCALNDLDDLKRGGSWGGENDSTTQRPEGLNYHPGKWFSWMDANYPESCPTLQSVLEMLGFGTTITHTLENNIHITLTYDNKTGQEELFIQALAPFTIRGEIEWRGEDGTLWKEVITAGKYKVLEGKIVFS